MRGAAGPRAATIIRALQTAARDALTSSNECLRLADEGTAAGALAVDEQPLRPYRFSYASWSHSPAGTQTAPITRTAARSIASALSADAAGVTRRSAIRGSSRR